MMNGKSYGEDTGREKKSGAESKPRVRVLQQFRERWNMTYELDCAGAPLTLRMFPTETDGWRLEARLSDRPDDAESLVTGEAPTRSESLALVVEAWNQRARFAGGPMLDGEPLAHALREIRAV